MVLYYTNNNYTVYLLYYLLLLSLLILLVVVVIIIVLFLIIDYNCIIGTTVIVALCRTNFRPVGGSIRYGNLDFEFQIYDNIL